MSECESEILWGFVCLLIETKLLKTEMPTGSSHLTFTMAAIVSAGGVMGYVKGRSVPSLTAGLIFGGIFVASGYMINSGREVAGFRTGLHTSALLAGVMGARFIKHRKVMPAGALAALSLLSSGYHGKKYVEWAEVELESETE